MLRRSCSFRGVGVRIQANCPRINAQCTSLSWFTYCLLVHYRCLNFLCMIMSIYCNKKITFIKTSTWGIVDCMDMNGQPVQSHVSVEVDLFASWPARAVIVPLLLGFLTKFRFAKISRNWLRNDFRVSRKWGTSFASFAVSRNCRDYERNDFRKTRKSRKLRKLEVKLLNLTIFLFLWRCLLKSSLG